LRQGHGGAGQDAGAVRAGRDRRAGGCADADARARQRPHEGARDAGQAEGAEVGQEQDAQGDRLRLHQLMTPEQLFGDLLAAEPTRPFVTYYDEATGERSELSVRSLANWVAKTHFLLIDELGLGVGDAALLALPAHWLSVSAMVGCLTAGLSFTN